jgi:hypothetical protein
LVRVFGLAWRVRPPHLAATGRGPGKLALAFGQVTRDSGVLDGVPGLALGGIDPVRPGELLFHFALDNAGLPETESLVDDRAAVQSLVAGHVAIHVVQQVWVRGGGELRSPAGHGGTAFHGLSVPDTLPDDDARVKKRMR